MAYLLFIVSLAVILIIFKKPSFIYGLSAFLILFGLGIIWIIGKKYFLSSRKIALMAGTFAFLIISFLGWCVFAESHFFRFLAAIIICLLLFWGVRFYERIGKDQPLLLANFLGYANLISFFFGTVVLLFVQAQLFSETRRPFLYFFYYIFVFLISCIILESYRLIFKQGIRTSVFSLLLYLSVIELIVIQFLWIIGYLSLSFYMQAILLLFVYYQVIGIIRHYMVFGEKGVSWLVVGRYLIIFFVGIIFLLGTIWY